MDLDQQFHEGMHPQEYVDQMQSHQNDLLYIYENFSTQVEDVPLFEEVQNKQWRALVLTEDWCGDAMLNLPIFLRIAEAAQIDTRFFLRDENPGLMDHYLTNGTSRSIPKIILIDSVGNEAAVWGPRAPGVGAVRFRGFNQPSRKRGARSRGKAQGGPAFCHESLS